MDGVTGRDTLIISEALATAIVTLEQLPSDQQPWSDMEDMKRILAEFQPPLVTALLAQAKCRLNPDLDPRAVFRSYGIEPEKPGDDWLPPAA